jgi:hypothetical protein
VNPVTTQAGYKRTQFNYTEKQIVIVTILFCGNKNCNFDGIDKGALKQSQEKKIKLSTTTDYSELLTISTNKTMFIRGKTTS